MKLDDRIELIELIGNGASGAVFKATQQGMERFVAVKALHQSALSDKEHVARFFREAQVVSALSHPNIVRMYAVGMADERQPYMVMDYIEGQTLADLISQRAISATDYLDIFIQVAAALSHAHRSEVVHRDIKPKNILIQRDAEKNKCIVKLADFGIARNVVPTTVQRITKTGVIIGSPIYMSPEQCTGRAVDHRTDLYSLGCVMFEAATGSVPFKERNAAGLIGKHVMEPAPPLDGRVVVADLSPYVAKVVEVLLNKKPDDRYPDADTLQKDLEAIQRGAEPPFAASMRKPRVQVLDEPQRNMNAATTTVIVGSMVAIALFFAARFVNAHVNADNNDSPIVVEVEKLSMQAGPHMEKKDFFHAERFYQRAHQLCDENHIGGKTLADVCLGQAFCEWQLKKLKHSNELFAKAYDYYRQTKNTRQTTELQRYWGLVCLQDGDFAKAVELLSAAFQAYDTEQVQISTYSKIGLMSDLCKAYTLAGKPYSSIALYPRLIQMENAYKVLPELRAPTHEHYAVALALVGRKDDSAKEHQIAQEYVAEQKHIDDRILAK